MTGAITVAVDDATIIAVPSVHGAAAFALHVNRLCADPATRPDVIAVELPPDVAVSLQRWLTDLDAASPEFRMPALLALLSRTDAAVETLFVTPSDSIVEAVRSGVERQLPIVGVDLPAAGTYPRDPRTLADPLLAIHDVPAFVHTHEAGSSSVRHPQIDVPREAAMTAHLKWLARRYSRILFVCGLAHWKTIRQHLADSAILAAPIPSAVPGSSQRVIVHPALALAHMDRLPALVTAFEDSRSTPFESRSVATELMDSSLLYADVMRAADRTLGERPRGLAADVEARPHLARILQNLGLLSNQVIPSGTAILDVASGVMTPDYQRALAAAIMDYPWATPDAPRLADVSVLRPAGPSHPGEVVLVSPPGWESPPFRLSTSTAVVTIPWEWQGEPDVIGEATSNVVLNWPPIDRSLFALSLDAARKATAAAAPRSHRFAGSICAGVDVRRTLRARTRGEADVWVKPLTRSRARSIRPVEEWEPMVWLFRWPTHPRARLLALAEELAEMLPFAPDRAALEEVQRDRGTVLLEQVAVVRPDADDRQRPARPGYGCYPLDALLLLLPNHLTLGPTARFLDDREYAVGPICRYPHPTANQSLREGHPVIAHYRDAYGVDLALGDPADTLIRMAIPFAREAVTVVAPDDCALPTRAVHFAAARRIELRRVSLQQYSAEQIDYVSTWFAVPTRRGTVDQFTDQAERDFGEPASTNLDLLPPFWRDYGASARRGDGR